MDIRNRNNQEQYNGICPVCGNLSPENFFPCEKCEELMNREEYSPCSICGLDLAGAGNPCLRCRSREGKSSLDNLRVLSPWSGPMREWLSSLKYGSEGRMADYLSFRLQQVFNACWPEATVVPIPPRPRKIFMEGFDPVAVLASGMKPYSVRVRSMLVRRGNSTQKSLGRSDRLSGKALHFSLKAGKDVSGKVLVLLDDVTTTGATLEYCATLLKCKGAVSVHGLAVCRD